MSNSPDQTSQAPTPSNTTGPHSPDSIAYNIFIALGFHNDQCQLYAFRNLCWLFLSRAARRLHRPIDHEDVSIETVTHDFMEEYEQRLWPKIPISRSHLDNQSILFWNKQARRQYDDEEDGITARKLWAIDHGEEMTVKDDRDGSDLYSTMLDWFFNVQDLPDPGCPLTLDQLLRCVLAGSQYYGDGTTMNGVPP